MAKILVVGRCGGTQTRTAQKTGKPYSITRFSEVPSQTQIDIFGDLGLPASDEVKEYVFEAGISKGLDFPQLVAVNPVPPAPSKK